MADLNQNKPLSELIGSLLADVTGLIRKEITLAKTEASESLSRALGGLETLGIGLVLAIGALGVLLSAAVTGVSVLLVGQGFTETAASALAALIVGLLVGIIAWAMISRGFAALRANNWKLERTAASIGRDAEVVKEKTS